MSEKTPHEKEVQLCLALINRLDCIDTPTGMFLNATWLKLSESIRAIPFANRKNKILLIKGDKITYDIP